MSIDFYREKNIMLYSSGMDSYIMRHIVDEPIDLYIYFDVNSRYSKEEINFLKKQNIDNLIIDNRLNLSDMEMDSAYIPFRNSLFITLAAGYGAKSIYIAVTNGDRANDKDLQFKKLQEDLLNYQLKPSWWLPSGREVTIEMPLKSMTKEEMIEIYLEKGHSIDRLIEETFSCYNPVDGKECLSCKADLRKYTAISKYYPIPENIRKKLIENIDIREIEKRLNGDYSRGREDYQIFKAYLRSFKPLQ